MSMYSRQIQPKPYPEPDWDCLFMSMPELIPYNDIVTSGLDSGDDSLLTFGYPAFFDAPQRPPAASEQVSYLDPTNPTVPVSVNGNQRTVVRDSSGTVIVPSGFT